VSRVLAQDPPDEQPITLLEHYTGSRWLAADVDDEVNVRIRRDGEKEAADGPAPLARQARTAVDELREALPAQAPGRVVAVHRHGATAVLRALSRAERAPATIAAI
jgi:predicted RNA-binding Zn ribbon-like protein